MADHRQDILNRLNRLEFQVFGNERAHLTAAEKQAEVDNDPNLSAEEKRVAKAQIDSDVNRGVNLDPRMDAGYNRGVTDAGYVNRGGDSWGPGINGPSVYPDTTTSQPMAEVDRIAAKKAIDDNPTLSAAVKTAAKQAIDQNATAFPNAAAFQIKKAGY